MKKTGFDFEGGKALDQALQGLGDPKAMRRAGLRALRRGARPIRDAARSNIRVRSGETRRDIKTRTESVKRGIAVWVGASGKKGGRAFIGRFLEFGTAKMRAFPWLRPAIDENKNEALDTVAESLGEQIEKEARKLAKK